MDLPLAPSAAFTFHLSRRTKGTTTSNKLWRLGGMESTILQQRVGMVKECMWNEWSNPVFLKTLKLSQVFGGHPKLLLTMFYPGGMERRRAEVRRVEEGGHSPWLNHSSIVSQGSSSNAKKKQQQKSREKKEEVWWKKMRVHVSRSCAIAMKQFPQNKSHLLLAGKEKKAIIEREVESEERWEKEYFWDWKEARWEAISGA